MENAVVYARYSSHSQTEQSIEGQLAAARNYANIKGYSIIHEYCDRAKTGTSDDREEFQRMLKDCSKGQFSVIIVWKVDRFGRNREEITFNKYKAKKAGVRVEYVAENITEGPEGVILESVLEGMAEYYSLQLSQNIKRGQYESAKKHLYFGGTIPFGYRTDGSKRFIIDEKAALIVQRIFENYANGMSMSQLVEWLNINGYKGTRGNAFNKNSLPRLLHNEMYRGVYKYKDLIYDEDAVPRIISDELFYAVQEKLGMNRIASSRWSKDFYFLTGKLYCECGNSMCGQSGTSEHSGKYKYYVCKKCGKRYRAEELESFVMSKIHEILGSNDTLDRISDLVWEYYLENDHEQEEIDSINGQLENINKSIANLVRAVEDGMPYDAVKSRLDSLNAEKLVLQREASERALMSQYKLTKDKIRFFIGQFDAFNDKNKEQLIHSLVNSIHVSPSEISIALNYCEEQSSPSCVKVELSKHHANLFVMQGVIVWRWKKE